MLSRPGAVDGLDIDTDAGAWTPVRTAAGESTGYDSIHVWQDPEDRWSSWLMRVPAAWTGSELPHDSPGGDEVFLISGELTLDRGDGPMTMTERSHFCDPSNPRRRWLRFRPTQGRVAIPGEAAMPYVDIKLARWTAELPRVRHSRPSVGCALVAMVTYTVRPLSIGDRSAVCSMPLSLC